MMVAAAASAADTTAGIIAAGLCLLGILLLVMIFCLPFAATGLNCITTPIFLGYIAEYTAGCVCACICIYIIGPYQGQQPKVFPGISAFIY